jgi:hypothetical protein
MTSQGPSASLNLFSNMGPVSSRDPGASQGQSTRADSLGTFATMSPTKLRHAAYEHATTYRTLLYNVNSDTTKITPTWGKVSETPWFGEARRLRGFGRPVVVRAMTELMINNQILFCKNAFISYYRCRARPHPRMLLCSCRTAPATTPRSE